MTGATGETLTERRRAATQWDIARAAAALFAEQGVAATTAEQIAAAAGVGLRTFYRYAPTKADAVAPIFTRGATQWRAELARIPAGHPLVDGVADVIGAELTPPDGDTTELDLTRALLRAVADDRDLQRIWYDVNGDSERRLVPVFAELTGSDDPLVGPLLAAAATDAIRLALEAWSAPGAPDDLDPAVLARDCFRRLTAWYDG